MSRPLSFLLVTLLLFAGPEIRRSSPPSPARPSTFALPLLFEANQGQFDPAVRFRARAGGCGVLLTSTEAVLRLSGAGKGSELRIRLAGGNARPALRGLERQPGPSNYFVGRDPAKWRVGVPSFAKVQYDQAYPGIDLVYYGNERRLEFDFVVSPGADPRTIGLEFQGADSVSIAREGDLEIEIAGSRISFGKPTVYQGQDARRREVAGSYVSRGRGGIGFEVAAYDRSLPLVIDPALLGFSSYLGGSGTPDEGRSIALDAQGNIYVTGATNSSDFPVAGPSTGGARGGLDVFVAKFNPTGSSLLYSTFVGGSSSETGYGIAVDSAGNAFVGGETWSDDFPTLNPYQSRFMEGSTDAFLFKLGPSGSLVFSTFLGGHGKDACAGIALDASASAYLTGNTASTDFPTTPGAFDRTCGTDGNCNPEFWARGDAFVTKFDSAGKLVYSTYLGGTREENLGGRGGIAVDSAGNAYVTGTTYSIDFPVKNPYQATRNGVDDAFVTKLDSAGSVLVWSTYLGGASYELGCGMALDAGGDVYVAGATESSDFPIVNAFQSTYAGAGLWNAFVARFSSDGARLVYSSFLGGKPAFVNGEIAEAIAVDRNGNAYVTGQANSLDFPGVNAFQSPQGSWDAFVAKVAPSGSRLVYCTTVGGSGYDLGYGIAVDSSGNAYVTGETESARFPTAFAFQQKLGGGQYDGFVTRIVDSSLSLSTIRLDLGDIPLGRQSKSQSITLTNTGSEELRIESIVEKSTGDAALCDAFALSHPALPFTIPAGGKKDVQVVFTPVLDEDYGCTLQITSDSPVRALGEVRLVGIGSGVVSIKTEYASVSAGYEAELSLKFTNPSSSTFQFDFYLVIVFPNGGQALMASAPFTLSADQVVKIDDIKFPISSAAPTGRYTIVAVAARSGTGVLASDSATFQVYRLIYSSAAKP